MSRLTRLATFANGMSFGRGGERELSTVMALSGHLASRASARVTGASSSTVNTILNGEPTGRSRGANGPVEADLAMFS